MWIRKNGLCDHLHFVPGTSNSQLFFLASQIHNQGFGLTIGSDLYLVLNKHARHNLDKAEAERYTMYHGTFHAENGTSPVPGGAIFGFAQTNDPHMVNGIGFDCLGFNLY
jgi:hypothetical protein